MNATSSDDPKKQVDDLRDQLHALQGERVAPALADAAAKAEAYTQQAKEQINAQTEQLSDAIRGSPFLALLIATGVGYVIGRVVR